MKPVIIHTDAKEMIKSQIDAHTRSTCASIVERSYALVDSTIKQTRMFNTPLGQAHSGYLRNLAVGFLFQEHIDHNKSSMTYTYEYNRNRSYKYLVLTQNNAKITFSQVASPYQTARPAYFRKSLEISNQGTYSFPDIDGNSYSAMEEMYLLLTYSRGGRDPKFINIGMPHVWRERINLLTEPRVLESDVDKVEVITEEKLVDFRKFIIEVEGIGD